MTSLRLARVAATLFVLAAGASSAAAQPTAAQAEQLFRDGKRLMSEGRIAEACTAFEGSQRKGPAVSTLLNLADCREKNGQLASAWGHFLEAARATRNDPAQAALHQTASDRADKLERRVSYIVINVRDESRVDGLVVRRNGTEVDPAEWNRKVPIDGGTYVIEGKAPGHEPWSATLTVGKEQDLQSVDVPRFHPLPASTPGGDDGPPRVPGSRWTGKRKAAVGVAAVGLGAGVGALLLELSARSSYDDAVAEDDPGRQGDLYDRANSRRLAAQIAGGVAVAAVGTAVVLWVTGAPPSAERGAALTPVLTHDRVGFAFTGRF